MKKLYSILLLALLFSVPAAHNVPPRSTWVGEKMRVVVVFRESHDFPLIESYGGEIVYVSQYSPHPYVSAFIPEDAVEALKLEPNVEYVQPDYQYHTTPDALSSSDESIGESLPWGVERVGGNIVWDSNGDLYVDSGLPTGAGIRVAVLDTGINYQHIDLWGMVVGGASFVEYTRSYFDDNGHGTMVAGVIAARDNGNGIVGMAPRVSLLAVKVADSDNFILSSGLADGIRWSYQEGGAKIISLSLSSNQIEDDLLVKNACADAYNIGHVLLIAASGNENADHVNQPARFDAWVIAVGAIFQANPMDLNPPARWVENATYGSNYGPELDFVAPTKVTTTTIDGSWGIFGGTSAAVPHVSGVAALIWSSKVDPAYDYDGNGQWDYDEVEAKMRATAYDLNTTGRDIYTGYGLINAWYANQRPPADVNYDAHVGVSDSAYISAHWYPGPPIGPLGYDRRADINIDNRVNIVDSAIVNANWGKVDP